MMYKLTRTCQYGAYGQLVLSSLVEKAPYYHKHYFKQVDQKPEEKTIALYQKENYLIDYIPLK